MHAVKVLRSCLGVVLNGMHARRCAALLDAVRALIAGRRLTLMELARSWPDALRVSVSNDTQFHALRRHPDLRTPGWFECQLRLVPSVASRSLSR